MLAAVSMLQACGDIDTALKCQTVRLDDDNCVTSQSKQRAAFDPYCNAQVACGSDGITYACMTQLHFRAEEGVCAVEARDPEMGCEEVAACGLSAESLEP